VFNQDTWTHLAVTWLTGGNIIEYVNGVPVKSIPAGPNIIKNTSSDLRIGAEGSSSSPYEWFTNGTIDEARISDISRSDKWIATEYNNTNRPDLFSSIGSEEPYLCSGSGRPYYVQGRSGNYYSTSQAQITLPYPTTGGDLLVLSLVVPPSISVSSVIDSRNGNVYNLANRTDAGTWRRLYTYYVSNSLDGGPITATVTLNGVATTLDVTFVEYGGVAAISPLDQMTANNASSGTLMDSGYKTITQAPSLIYGFGAGDYVCHANPPSTDRETANGRCAMDQIVASTGTYNIIATQSPSGNWALQMFAFKGA
jgi:hypothetical protein